MFKPCRLIRLPEVKAMTGLSKSTIYARMSDGSFPKQIPLSTRVVAWSEHAIQQWIQEHIDSASA